MAHTSITPRATPMSAWESERARPANSSVTSAGQPLWLRQVRVHAAAPGEVCMDGASKDLSSHPEGWLKADLSCSAALCAQLPLQLSPQLTDPGQQLLARAGQRRLVRRVARLHRELLQRQHLLRQPHARLLR